MADQKTRANIAKQRDVFLNDSIARHQERLASAIEELENNIIDMASDLKMKSGVLLGLKINIQGAQKIHSDIIRIFDEIYGKAARNVVKDFDKIVKYIENELKDMKLGSLTAIDRDMIDVLKFNTWESFNQFGLQSQTKLVDAMYKSIIGKAKFSETINRFKGILSGHKDITGRPMSTYAELYVNDSIMNFHNAVHLKKAEDNNVKYFQYYGGLIHTSRKFCIQRSQKIYSKKLIESWKFHWTGKSGPALTHRGGYNCRHHWVAVKKEWLEKDEKVIE